MFSLELQERLFDDVLSFDGFLPGMPLLIDNRQVTMSTADHDMIKRSVVILQNFNRLHSKGRVAWFVNRDVNFGFFRQFEIIADMEGECEFRVFTDEPAAIHWLLSSATAAAT